MGISSMNRTSQGCSWVRFTKSDLIVVEAAGMRNRCPAQPEARFPPAGHAEERIRKDQAGSFLQSDPAAGYSRLMFS